MHADRRLLRAHGSLALSLALFFLSNLLGPFVPLFPSLLSLGGFVALALAYSLYFQAPTLKGQRWRPAVAAALTVAGVLLQTLTGIGVARGIAAGSAEAVAGALRANLLAVAAAIALNTLAWYLLGTSRDPGLRIRGLLAAAMAVAVVNAGFVAIAVAPNVATTIEATFAGGLPPNENNTASNAVFAAFGNATAPYRVWMDLGSTLPGLLALGAFYLLWERERRLPRAEDEGEP